MEEFNKIPSYIEKFKYADEHLKKLESDSARAIYQIDSEKVLKIAKTGKGVVQNEIERRDFLRKEYMEIVTKIFDYDKSDRWLITELVKEITPSRFKAILGFSIDDLKKCLSHFALGFALSLKSSNKQLKLDDDLKHVVQHKWYRELINIIIETQTRIEDFCIISRYGEVIRNGKPKVVIADYNMDRFSVNDYAYYYYKKYISSDLKPNEKYNFLD